MQRIGTGDSLFHDGDPISGTLGTVVTEDFLNAIQEELARAIEAYTALNPADSGQLAKIITAKRNNAIIDGCCRVGQSQVLTLVNNTWGYGKVDMFAGMASGTAVSAGTLTQSAAAPVGRTGHAVHFSGVTITGAGVVYLRHRIEALEARGYKNQQGSFSCLVYHDVGANVNYTVTVRKATVADNFTATTVIASGVAQAVTTATGTLLKFENIAMGDCSNGIEIEVRADCGAVTNKNFYFTELGFDEGAIAPLFIVRPIAHEQALCMRHYEAFGVGSAGTEYYSGQATATTTAAFVIPFKVNKRATPVVGYTGTITNSGVTNSIGNNIALTAIAVLSSSTRNMTATATVAAGLVAGNASLLALSPTSPLYADSRL